MPNQIEENNQQEEIIDTKPKNALLIILSVVATAIIVGGLIYLWQQSKLNTAKQSAEQQIASLNNQITDLQSQKTEFERILSGQNTNNATLEKETIDTTSWLHYTNPEKLFSIKYPSDYNSEEKNNDNYHFSTGQDSDAACANLDEGEYCIPASIRITVVNKKRDGDWLYIEDIMWQKEDGYLQWSLASILKIDDKKFFVLSPRETEGFGLRYLTENNDYIFDIRLSGDATSIDEDILSTLQF